MRRKEIIGTLKLLGIFFALVPLPMLILWALGQPFGHIVLAEKVGIFVAISFWFLVVSWADKKQKKKGLEELEKRMTNSMVNKSGLQADTNQVNPNLKTKVIKKKKKKGEKEEKGSLREGLGKREIDIKEKRRDIEERKRRRLKKKRQKRIFVICSDAE